MRKTILLMVVPGLLLLGANHLQAQASPSAGKDFIEKYWETKDTNLLHKAQSWGEAQGDLQVLGDVCRAWGRHYADLETPNVAVPYFLKAMDIFQRAGDQTGLMKTNINLGFMYFNLNELELAVKHTEAALQLSVSNNDLQTRAIILANLGSMYEHTPGQIEKAVSCHTEALSLSRQLNDTIGMMGAYNNLGVLHERAGRTAPAAAHYLAALELSYALRDSMEICRILSNLASLEIRSGQPKPALRYLEQSNVYCQQSYLNLQIYRHKLLASAYKLSGRFQEAYSEMSIAAELNDSLYVIDRSKAIHELTIEYETEKKEQQIAMLEIQQELQKKAINQQNILQKILWGGLATLGGFAAIFFFQRNRISNEKARSENLLRNILPADVAEELKTTGHSNARQYAQCTVLFTDFVNFTEHAERMSPQALVDELHTCFKTFDQIVEMQGLEKIKTIGDAYLAVCGLPVARQDHAERACQAAILIHQFVQNRLKEGGLFQIRIGLHSGPVIAGIVGVNKYAFDIWGDTVNTAARMEQHSEAGKINISNATFEQIKGHFRATHRGKVAVKNKGAVDMYFLEA